ncbi:MAG TPA: HAD family hydrolase, partial [Acidimicrobiia bacterium]|nr:HAD family hydrolase [Acidimicrobiia bacterium]
MTDDPITRLADRVDAVLLDVGGTLVDEAPAGTAVADLRPEARPGVADTLGALSGRVRVAAVTNTAVMGEADVRRLLDTAGLGPFEVVVTSAEVGAAKPDPAPIHAALARLAVAPDRALYVGDRTSDRDAARAAGTAFSATDRGLADALERAAAASDGATACAVDALVPV